MNLPALLIACVLTATLATTGSAHAAPPERVHTERQGEVEHRFALDADGRFDLGALLHTLLTEAVTDLTFRPPKSLALVRVPARGTVGQLTMAVANTALKPVGIGLRVERDHVVVRVDRVLLEQQIDELEKTVRSAFGGGPAVYKLEQHLAATKGGPPVVLIHGLNARPERFETSASLLGAKGYDVYVYHFPHDGRIIHSATELGIQARRLYDRLNKPLSVVGVSMGAIIAAAWVDLDTDFRGEVDRVIAVAPPFAGSPLARFHPLFELGETLLDVIGEGMAGLFPFDGLGQAAGDLLPGSALLERLESAPRRAGVTYSVIATSGDFLPKGSLDALKRHVQKLAPDAAAGDMVASMLTELTDAVEAVSGRDGDGAVALKSQGLKGVSDRVVTDFHHLEVLGGSKGAGVADVPALQEVLERLPATR